MSEGDDKDPAFSQVTILEAPSRARAVAVDPSGRWLTILNGRTATEGDSLHVYDLSTVTQSRPPLYLDGVSAAAISPDGQMAIVVGEGLFGAIAFSIPELEEVFRAEARDGRQIIRNSEGSAYFVGGSFGTYRLTASGAVLPDTLGLQQVIALVLSSDEQTLLAITIFPGGPKLHALSTTDMTRRGLVPLPLTASVLIPLANPQEVLVLGTTAEHPFRGPIVATVVNWASGTVEPARVVATGNDIVYFGAANPSIHIAPTVVLVVSSYGAIEVNMVTREIRLLRDSSFEGGSPCCAITFDEAHQRVLAAERRVNFEVGGRVIVFEREP